MRQTLFYIPHEIDVLGLPVFGAGLVLILWALVSVIGLAVMVRRQGWSAEVLGYIPLVLVVAAVIYFVLPQMEEGPAGNKLGVPIRGYGVMLLLAVVSGVGLAAWRARRVGLGEELIYSLAFWMFLGGIAGARLFFVIQYHDQFLAYTPSGNLDLASTLRGVLNVTRGGLVVYGSFLGGVLAYGMFVFRKKLPPLQLADLIAPSMILGLAIGRVGCLLNGCCFGGVCETNLPALTFPAANPPYQMEPSPPYARQLQLGQLHGFTLGENEAKQPVIARVWENSPAAEAGLSEGASVQAINGHPTTSLEAAMMAMYAAGSAATISTEEGTTTIDLGALPPRSLPVHPTQVYSALNAFVIFLVLWFYYPYRRYEGEVFALLITIYPVMRMLLEWARVDEAGRFGTSLTISQWTSILILLAAAGVWAWVLRQPRLPMPGEAAS